MPNFFESCGLKATGIFVLLLEMVLNAIQKQSFKQSLHEVSSKAAICRYSLKYVFLKISCEYCKIFKNSVFIENLPRVLFQFDKVTVLYWASANLLFLTKHTMWDGFIQLKSFVDLFRVR